MKNIFAAAKRHLSEAVQSAREERIREFVETPLASLPSYLETQEKRRRFRHRA